MQVLILAQAMVRVGLRKPSEHTFGHWVAVMVAAQPGCDAEVMQRAAGEDGLQLVQHLKASFADLLVTCAGVATTAKTYPPTVA